MLKDNKLTKVILPKTMRKAAHLNNFLPTTSRKKIENFQARKKEQISHLVILNIQHISKYHNKETVKTKDL